MIRHIVEFGLFILLFLVSAGAVVYARRIVAWFDTVGRNWIRKTFKPDAVLVKKKKKDTLKQSQDTRIRNDIVLYIRIVFVLLALFAGRWIYYIIENWKDLF